MEERSCLPLDKDASRRVEVFDRNRTIPEFWPQMLPRDAFVANLDVQRPTGSADHQTLGTSQLIGVHFNRQQRDILPNERPTEAWTGATAPGPARS